MSMVTIEKCEFGQLNDKRYILPDGICSLSYGHFDLKELTNNKGRLMTTPQGLIKNHEKKLLELEHKLLENIECMRIYSSIQQPIFYSNGSLKHSLKKH